MMQLAKTAIKAVAGVIMLPFAVLRQRTSASGWAWLAHFGLLAVILGGLAWLNLWLRLDMVVQAPSLVLRQVWLPLMFVVAYSLGWCLWWTWLLWKQPGPMSPFPDIQEAWQSALEGLAESDLSLTDRPVVLLLGAPASREQSTLASFEINATCGPRPALSSAPVRVMADEQAVYISAPGVSAVAAQAEQWYESRYLATTAEPQATAGELELAIPAGLRATSAAESEATANGNEIGLEEGLGLTGDWPSSSDMDYSSEREAHFAETTISRAKCETMRARLRYLATLVRESREGHVPFDGVALCVPGESIASKSRADLMSRLVQGDLDTLSTAAGAVAPVVCVVSDLDEVAGCSEVLKRLPEDRQHLLLGTELSLEADDSNSRQAIGEKIQQLCGEMVPAVCFRLFKTGKHTGRGNRRLFGFQHAIAQRCHHYANLVASVAHKCQAPWPVVGTYLVATGHSDPTTRGFGQRVLSHLTDLPGRAKWTSAMEQSDRACKRWARVASAAAVLVAGATLLTICL